MPNCRYCVHSIQSFLGGEIRCGSEKAWEDLEEQVIRENLAAEEHDCPHFEDDQLPW